MGSFYHGRGVARVSRITRRAHVEPITSLSARMGFTGPRAFVISAAEGLGSFGRGIGQGKRRIVAVQASPHFLRLHPFIRTPDFQRDFQRRQY